MIDIKLIRENPELVKNTILKVLEFASKDYTDGQSEKIPQLPLTMSSLQNEHLYLLDTGNSLLLYEHGGSSNP